MSEESPVILNLGDKWPEHYRGTKYHFNEDGEVWWHLPHEDIRIYAQDGHVLVVTELLKLRPEGGSFRITECGDVLTKKKNGKDWEPIYVCEMDAPLTFPDLDNTCTGLTTGDLWRGFYDGAKYSFLGRRIWWKNPELRTRQFTHETLPLSILKELTFLKPTGGSFAITENGHVLTLILPQPLPTDIRKQHESLSNAQKRVIETKTRSTKMLPVYIGDFFEGFTLQRVRKLTDPLSEKEANEMIKFLNQYGAPKEDELFPIDFDDEVEDDWP